MLKPILIALAGALATAILTYVLVSPPAHAVARECKTDQGALTACTDTLNASPRGA